MASTSSRILQVVRQRPVTFASVTTVGGAFTYASWVQYNANRQEQLYWKQHPTTNAADQGQLFSTTPTPILPRVYSWDALQDYWSIRPLTAVGRLLEIGGSLGPLVARYVWDFHLVPSLDRLTHVDGNAAATATNDDNTQKNNLIRQHAIEWRHALTRLGPAFVKAGQQLSIRPDLVPPIVLEELQQLCDSVQPVPDDIAMAVLQEELGGKSPHEVYDNLHLVAAASLGQVYKGNLKTTGDIVAVKVQRPGMVKAFSLDLFLLQCWGIFMDGWTSVVTHQKPYHKDFLQNFAKGGYGELDYELEAKNQRLFQEEMRARSCPVVVPNVYDDYTTRRVLTTQWMDGIRLSDAPPETIRKLIPIGVELFLCQLLDIGAFHADPHPGNLLVTPEGKLCLLDFGLCATVDPHARAGMTQALVHLLARDFHSLVHEDSKQLGFLPEDFDTTELKPILTKILTGGLLEAGSNLHTRKRKLMEISNELNQVFFQYPFSVPPFFALVTRGLGLLEGIALTGDPEFDIFRASAPYATKRAMQMAMNRSWTTKRNPVAGVSAATAQ